MRKIVSVAGVVLMFMMINVAAEAASRSRSAIVAQYRALQYKESCAWRRVVQAPLWSAPGVSYGAFLLAWDCDWSEARAATRARVEFGRRHRILRDDPHQQATRATPVGF